MKAKANKRLDFIDIIDAKTVHRCHACTDEEYDTCSNWTSDDCKDFLKGQGGDNVLVLERKFWTCIPRKRSSYITWHSTKEEAMEEAKRLKTKYGITCDVKEMCNG